MAVVERIREWATGGDRRGDGDGETRTSPKKKEDNQTKHLLEMASAAELFHDPKQITYARLNVRDHREVWSLRSATMRRWLSHLFYMKFGKAPGSQAVEDVLRTLEGRAQFEGPECSVHVRLVEHLGAIYLDLADDKWQVVEVTPVGWRVINDPPVRFRRPAGMLPLPVPIPGGRFDDLRRFVNFIIETTTTGISASRGLSQSCAGGGPTPSWSVAGNRERRARPPACSARSWIPTPCHCGAGLVMTAIS